MRIRRKKNLDIRLAALTDYIIPIDDTVKDARLVTRQKDYINFCDVFIKEQPLRIEVGCGKGGFITELATRNPNVNFIAVEMMDNIIMMAAENAKRKGLTNVKFFNTGAQYLPRYFKENSVETVYLNFSPPHPQKSYECRRLTNDNFINVYNYLLHQGGSIEQKTDDKNFFEYSLKKLTGAGFKVYNVTQEKNFAKRNVQTEYEKNFYKTDLPYIS
ncbi:MAG TPA: tRNA (guanosine(46)-N7)-methyltransferase TrmB [Clostridiales bacterium]|nr:tRNA (guanosine(46)-N7)-methyltransferase TrmB [Clostridiales bacterium]